METYDDLRSAIASQIFVKAESGVRMIDMEGGPRANWIFDFRALMLQPKWLDRYTEIFWAKYGAKYPFQVCGLESASISLVAAIVMKSMQRGTPVNGFFIRKSRKREGLMKQIEGVVTDDPIVMVDDLINSGGTFNKILKVLDDADKQVSDIFVILAFRDRRAYEFASARGIVIRSLFTLEDFGLPLLKSPAIPAESFDIQWRFKATDPSFHFVNQKSAPVIDKERIYFGSDSGTFYALNQSDGSVAWTFETKKHPEGKGIFSSPVLHGEAVFFGAYDGNVYALNAQTGEKIWENGDADWVGSSPSVAPDLSRVFIGLEFGLWKKRGGIAALNIKTGETEWVAYHPSLTHGSPLYIKEESLVVIGSNNGVMYAYDARKGDLRWTFVTEGDIKTSAAYDPKRRAVLFGSMDGKLYALAARDGSPLFAFETGAGIYSIPLIIEDTVYVASLDKSLYAVDLATGARHASFDTSGRIFASPISAEGSVWIGSNDGRLYELDPGTLKLQKSFQISERIVNKIAYNAATRKFFVPSVANELYCIARK